jgi:hypothetical protein
MNDFTKEDLEYMERIFIGLVKNNEDTLNINIVKKLQAMIDNYCNHKNIVTGAYPSSNPPKKCDACGVLYYE